MSTIDLNDDTRIESHYHLKTLLVPLHPISGDVLQQYASLLRQCGHCISIGSLTLTPLAADSPFSALSWKHSKIRHSFITHNEAYTSDGGSKTLSKYMTDWSDLHPHQRIHLVIGVIHAPSLHQLDKQRSSSPTGDGNNQHEHAGTVAQVKRSFESLKQFVAAQAIIQPICFKGFTFAPLNDTHIDTFDELSADIIVFPNQETERMLFYLSTSMNEMTTSIINAFHVYVRSCISRMDTILLKSPVEAAVSGDAQTPSTMSVTTAPAVTPATTAISPTPPSQPPVTNLNASSPAANAVDINTVKKSPTPLIALSHHHHSSSMSTLSLHTTTALNLLVPESASTKQKKLRSGRMKKHIADHCLLIGDHVDATRYFKQAVDLCKTCHDYVWLASCYEGLAAAISLAEDEAEMTSSSLILSTSTATGAPTTSVTSTPAVITTSPQLRDSVIDHFNDAMNLYNRVSSASILSIQAALKLSRYYLRFGRISEGMDVLMRMYELPTDVSAHEQINMCTEAAIICRQHQCHRKYAFFMVQAAGLYKELHQYAACAALLMMCMNVYRIDGLQYSLRYGSQHDQHHTNNTLNDIDEADDDHADDDNDDNDNASNEEYSPHNILDLPISAPQFLASAKSFAVPSTLPDDDDDDDNGDTDSGVNKMNGSGETESALKHLRRQHQFTRLEQLSIDRRRERGYQVGRWVALQRSMMEHLIFSAQRQSHVHTAVTCMIHLLRTLHSYMDRTYQRSIINTLQAATELLPVNTTVDCTGLPIVHSVSILEVNENVYPHIDTTLSSVNEHGERTHSQSRLHRLANEADDHVFVFSPDAMPTSSAHSSRHTTHHHHQHHRRGESDAQVHYSRSSDTTNIRPLRYVCGESMQARVILSNPLLVDLYIQSLTLCTDGIHYESYEIDCHLSAQSGPISIILIGKPLSAGQLCIKGIRIRMMSLLTEHSIDRFGRGLQPLYLSQPPTITANTQQNMTSAIDGKHNTNTSITHNAIHDLSAIEIINAQPLLECTYEWHGLSHGTMYNGERRKTLLRLKNVSQLAIHECEMSINVIFKLNTQQSQLAYYSKEELEAESAQLKSRGSRRQSLAMTNRPSLSSTHPTDDLPSRTQSQHSAHQSNDTTSAHQNTLLWDSSILAKSLPLLPGHSVDIPLIIDATHHADGLKYTVCYAAQPTSPIYRMIQQSVHWTITSGISLLQVIIAPAKVPICDTDIKQNGIRNQNFSVADATAFPSSHRRLHSLQKSNHNQCLIIVELTNTAAVSFHVRVAPRTAPGTDDHSLDPDIEASSTSAFVEKECRCRIMLPLTRMSFGHELDSLLRQFCLFAPLPSTDLRSQQIFSVTQRCLSILNERIELQWTSSDGQRGRLPALEISSQHLVHLIPETISFQMTLSAPTQINNAVPQQWMSGNQTSIHRVRVGEFRHVRLTVRNDHPLALRLLCRLRVRYGLNSSENPNSDDERIIIAGTRIYESSTLQQTEYAQWTVALCPLIVGEIRLQLTAKTLSLSDETHHDSLTDADDVVASDKIASDAHKLLCNAVGALILNREQLSSDNRVLVTEFIVRPETAQSPFERRLQEIQFAADEKFSLSSRRSNMTVQTAATSVEEKQSTSVTYESADLLILDAIVE